MVECEYGIGRDVVVYQLVLIDTWWNVNTQLHSFLTLHPQVLIDTWWNVNTLLHEPLFRTDHVLIDTWWNVNLFSLV